MTHHPLSSTTHTLDMLQIDQIDARLTAPGALAVTAADLAVADPRVPPTARLTGVHWRGAPEFPDIHGDFAAVPGSPDAPVHVPLHTAHLQELSRRLGLHHHWGV